jgi:glutamate-1-semialdehyde 2,1-aminomutase
VKKAKGAYLWDVDGNKYIDYRLAFGPIIIGHADDEVNAKVHEEIDLAVLCAMTNELELTVAEMIIEMCPAVEMVRLACSGTEATMHALRVARAFTGREKVIKFEGMYHGFQDYTLFSTYAPSEAYGNINNPIPIPASSGIPKSLNDLIITLPFNNFDILDKVIKRIGYEVAAVIAEPCLGNCAAIEPAPGFLEYIRKKCTEYGIVFILDEVKTGFRIAKGGAQEYYHIMPDLATYAKAIGNGFPVAAFGGKREIMSIIGSGVAQGGTYNNNKPGVAAAYATLKLINEKPILETIEQRGRTLMSGIKEIFEEYGITACINGYPAMFSFAVGKEKVTAQRDWQETDRDYYLRLVEYAIDKGVMPDHDPREPWFLSYSHSDEDISETLNVMSDAVKFVVR